MGRHTINVLLFIKKSMTEKTYSIINAYAYNDKNTWEKKFVIQALLQANFPVKWPRSFYYGEEEFLTTFEKYIDEDRFDFGLLGLKLKIKEIISVEYTD